MIKETGRWLYWTIVASVLVLVVLALIGFGAAGMMRPMLNVQRQAIQASNEYVQSKQAELSIMAQNYRRLDIQAKDADPATATAIQAQQRAIRDEMRRVVDLIPEDAITSDVRAILGGR